ncbi:MAG: dephospho-CoA kinase [Clostridia bacterium]|nr:dephospho-CoA kinase [Clostridia bacterium]
MDKKFLIIVTGKSGVGKSKFSYMLAENLDAMLLNLDKISHLSLEDEYIKTQLKNAFGEEIFDENKINRKKLGKIVFNEPEKLNYLNNLSQKFMEDYIDNTIIETRKNYIILEYALLTKMKYFNDSDYKILIVADKNIRFSRLKERDNVSDEYLELREKNLPDFTPSDFNECIDNHYTEDKELKEISKKLAKKIQTLNS